MARDGMTNDVILEILTRASLETVGRCRSVSQEWNEMTHEPAFRTLHSARTGRIDGFFVQGTLELSCTCSFVPLNGRGPELSLSFLPVDNVRILASHGGILCASARADRRPYVQWLVCRPSTKEWTRIPNPRTRYESVLTAMVVLRSKPEVHYKILRVSSHAGRNIQVFICEVFDSETGRWKRLTQASSSPDWPVFSPLNTPAVVGGTAFWIAANHPTVFSFDMYNETWDEFPVTIPGFTIEAHRRRRLMNTDGKLGFVLPRGGDEFLDLWVMDRRSRAWTNTKRISAADTGFPVGSPLALCGTNVALLQGISQVVLCRFPPSAVDVFETKHIAGSQVFPYCSDLEPGTLRSFVKTVPKTAGGVSTEPAGRTRNWTEIISRLANLLLGPWISTRIFSIP